MPRRLLLAAEILREVAREVNAADRPLLESAAAELADRATELLAEEARLDDATELTPIGRAVAGFGPATGFEPATGFDHEPRRPQALSVH